MTSTCNIVQWSVLDRRADTRSLIMAAVLLAISLASHGLTEIAEAARAQIPLSDAHIWVLEATSHITLLLLAPMIGLVLNRAPLGPGLWACSVPLHIFAAVGFSIAHVCLMWPARLFLFPRLVGYPYTFDLMSVTSLQYEFAKDLFTYVLMVVGFIANRLIERRVGEAHTNREKDAAAGRLTLGAGGRRLSCW